MDKVPITFDGLKKMEEELKNLIEIERPKIIIAVSEARDHGDLSENAEYSAAREKHAFIEGKINELEDKIARAEVIDISKISGDRIKFGAKVHILDENSLEEKHLQIVGEYEADVDNGKISINSPLSKALIGRESGDLIEVNTPSGSKNYEIISFNYKVD